jgi:hypothetical protein
MPTVMGMEADIIGPGLVGITITIGDIIIFSLDLIMVSGLAKI